MIAGRKPIPDEEKAPGTKNLPKVEKQEFQEMFAFYEGLGKGRTLRKVSEQFGKSLPYISMISRAFKWRERLERMESLPIDPLVSKIKPQTDDTRTKLATIVNDVVDTLHELAFISKAIKRGQPPAEYEMRRVQLLAALGTWGFEWKSPKSFKELVDTLKEVVQFNDHGPGGGNKTTVNHPQQINVKEFKLVIKDD